MSAPNRKKKKTNPKGKKAPGRKAPAPKVSKTKKATKAPPEEEKSKRPATKAKKRGEKKEAPDNAKVAVKAEPLRLGPPPEATVASRHIDSMHERPGRGFSFGELASAGVPLNAARRQGLQLDIRRRSVVEGNVEVLRVWFKSPAKSSPETAAEPIAVPAAGKKK